MIEIKCTEKEKSYLQELLIEGNKCLYADTDDVECMEDCEKCIENNIKWDIQPEKLKPCPFCGSENIYMVESSTGYHVRCRNCGIGTKYNKTSQEAADIWNNRVKD